MIKKTQKLAKLKKRKNDKVKADETEENSDEKVS